MAGSAPRRWRTASPGARQAERERLEARRTGRRGDDRAGGEMAAQELAGRTALVTGGSRGIGRAVCVRLAQEGARLGINYARNDEAARATERLVEAAAPSARSSRRTCPIRRRSAAMVAEAERSSARSTFWSPAPASRRPRCAARSRSRPGAGSWRSTSTAPSADHGRQGRHDGARLRADRLLRLDRRAAAAPGHARVQHLQGGGDRVRAQLLRGLRAARADQLHRARADRHRHAGGLARPAPRASA